MLCAVNGLMRHKSKRLLSDAVVPAGGQRSVRCAVNKQAQQAGQELLEQVAAAERERAAAPGEAPLGEWEALRVRPDHDGALTSQALLASSEEAQDLLQACPTSCSPSIPPPSDHPPLSMPQPA